MKENKTNYIKLYPKTRDFKEKIVEAAKENQLSTTSYILQVLKKELDK